MGHPDLQSTYNRMRRNLLIYFESGLNIGRVCNNYNFLVVKMRTATWVSRQLQKGLMYY
jgi:hypothetical protein